MYIQKANSNSVINPENPFLIALSAALYEVLEAEFERAPINEELPETLKAVATSNDFYQIKDLFIRLATLSYLFKPFVEGRREGVDRVIDAFLGEDLASGPRNYAFQTILSFNKKTGPLSLYIKDWLSMMHTQWGLESEADKIAAIEALPYSFFLLENYDTEYIFLKELSGKTYQVLREAFEGGCPDVQLQQNKVLMTSLVQYDGLWMPNGLSVWYTSTEVFDVIAGEKAKKEKEEGPLLCLRKPGSGNPMLYFRTGLDFDNWIKAHTSFNESMTMPDDVIGVEFPAVYLCRDEGILFLSNGSRVIYDKDNPYYDKTFAQENALAFLVSETVTPKELLHHMVDNKMLPDAHMNHFLGSERGLALVQENLDFMARFMRSDDY